MSTLIQEDAIDWQGEIARKDYVDVADADLQSQIDAMSSGLHIKGTATVAEINALTDTSADRDAWRMLDAGTITIGAVDVAIDDVIVWNTDVWINVGPLNPNAAWGNINGTLSDQVDLQTALDGKAATVHNHGITQIPAANNSATAGTGFGGFRYQVTGNSLALFTT